MSALLVYKNETPEVLAWAKDYREVSRQVGEQRTAWLDAFCAEHDGPGEEQRGTYSRGDECVGAAWPDDLPVPKGWKRPADDPRLIKPDLRTKIGKAAQAELDGMTWPDARTELSRQFGMRSWVVLPDSNRYYTPGYRIEDDSVWAMWGSRDVAPVLTEADDHGWVRVPLTEYIARFGEDAL